jgi:hypothetical protein
MDVVAVRVPPDWGGPLTDADYATLLHSWITPEIANQAMLRRVDAQDGREVIGQKGRRNCAGILFPYYWPGEMRPFIYRVRRDRPELVQGKNGQLKPDRKYLGAPGSGNRLYVPPGITLEQLADPTVPVVLVEGEKKALALWRLANHQSERPRFIPIAISGVWNWLGTKGKTGGPNGERLDVRGPITDLDRFPWSGRTVFVLFDVNLHFNDSVRAARKGLARELTARRADVKLINLPEDCGVNGVDDLLAVWGPARVLDLFEQSVSGARMHVVPPPQFKSTAEGMFRVVTKGEQLTRTQLSNYQASIKTNIILDDGVETTSEFEINAELAGRLLCFNIPASRFAAMDWPIEYLGPAAITYPGQREYARTAIQGSSFGAEERRIYAHAGWREINGGSVFLHAGGAIGGCGAVPGVAVRLSGALGRYQLCSPGGDELARAVQASIRLVELGPPLISFPLLAATYRAVFGGADFALHIAGETGAFKSELAALHQQHFGSGMDRMNLPCSWSSTGNALEVLAFQAKDTLLVVDDFAPQGSTADVGRYHATADRIFRAAGNHAGRSRLDSTAKLREARPPRALILSTGEDIPRGHSLRARLLLLELSKGSVESADLSKCQNDANQGLYVTAMSGFLHWMAGRYERTRADFDRLVSHYRVPARGNAGHARTPEIVSHLQAGFESFLEFAEECGAISDAARGDLAERCWQALQLASAAQAKHHAATEPTTKFLDTVRGLLAAGRAHLESRSGLIPERGPGSCGWKSESANNWSPRGDCIGWVEGDDIYLEPAASYGAVQGALRVAGECLGITEHTLRKRLHERGLLTSTDHARTTLTVRKSLGGATRSVLHFSRSLILPEDPEPDD